MFSLAGPKIFKFSSDTAITLDSDLKLRDYAIENNLINISATRLSKIKLELTVLNHDPKQRPWRVRVFYFKHLATYQSEILRFDKNIGIYEFTPEESRAWLDKPLMIDSIGFAPIPRIGVENDNSILEVKVSVFAKPY